MTQGPTIAFFPEASFGAALNCVAIARSHIRSDSSLRWPIASFADGVTV